MLAKLLFLFNFQIEHILPSAVPILNNDRPYTIEVYDCANQQKIEVLRINLADDKQKTGIEMGKSILKSPSNKVAPILDENSILKDTSAVSQSFFYIRILVTCKTIQKKSVYFLDFFCIIF